MNIFNIVLLLFFFSLFACALMINYVYVHSLFLLSLTRTYTYTKYRTCIQWKGTREHTHTHTHVHTYTTARKWEGLINGVCSRQWRCWMTFFHMDSIYGQAYDQNNDWHLSCIRYVGKITQVILSSTYTSADTHIHIYIYSYRWE